MDTGPGFHYGFADDASLQSQSAGSSHFLPPNNLGAEQTLPDNGLDDKQSLKETDENKEKKHAETRKAIAKWWYSCNIPFHVARSPYYVNMINVLAGGCAEFKIPTYDDLRGPLLDECLEDVRLHIEDHKKIWARNGCTIMLDESMDGRGCTIINFLVASTEGFVFLKSVDATDKINIGLPLFALLEDAVLEVGPQNVVQVITKNSAAYEAAGKLLEERFPTIFWTPFATHCIDLMLKDIGEISWVKEAMDNAKKITKLIYNDEWALNLMKQHTDGSDIIRPGITWFATDFLTLERIHFRRWGLKRMFVCDEWTESSFSISEEGRLIYNIIFDEGFWKTSHEIIQVSEPLLKVLHIVNNLDKSPMGYLYETMDKAKKVIAGYYKNIEVKYQPFWKLIDHRWSTQLHKPIHATGYYLNPKYFYEETFVADEEVLNGLYVCLERMIQDEQKIPEILRELQIYKNVEGCLFSSALSIRSRTTLNPGLWWESFGAKTPLLQQGAIRILSQPCNFPKYEHNWSRFEHVHSKKCNELVKELLNKLMYVQYNLVLRYPQIDGVDNNVIDLDEIDPTSEWITELETKQPARENNLACIESHVAQEITAMEETKVQVQTSPATMKAKRKKRAYL